MPSKLCLESLPEGLFALSINLNPLQYIMPPSRQPYRAVSGQDDPNEKIERTSLQEDDSNSDDGRRGIQMNSIDLGGTTRRSAPQAGEHRDEGAMKKKTVRRGWCASLRPSKRTCIFITIIIAIIIAAAAGGGIVVYKTAPKDGLSPPWYPTPRGGSMKNWEESYEKARALVEKMSLVEKVNVTTGTG